MTARLAILGLGLWLHPAAWQARAVIFYSTDDPAYNTAEPTGTLAGSGWQYQGLWGGILGTPISSNLFLTAKHVHGAVGDLFTYQGQDYPALEAFPDPETDLLIWRVCGVFPAFAPLYASADEVGEPCVVFGRGIPRGGPVTVTNGAEVALKGWLWGTPDGKVRWGENTVSRIYDGGAGAGSLLVAAFDAAGGTNEAVLSGGDSGGGVFIAHAGVWQLAAINYAVDSPYNLTNSGPGFAAAIFDQRGLYTGGEGAWSLVPDLGKPEPGGFYATRISARLPWIQSIIAQTAGKALPVLQSAPAADGPYSDNPAAVFQPDASVIVLPLPTQNQFYRLRYCRALRLSRIGVSAGQLHLRYEQ